jgi:hypothetical protein
MHTFLTLLPVIQAVQIHTWIEGIQQIQASDFDKSEYKFFC